MVDEAVATVEASVLVGMVVAVTPVIPLVGGTAIGGKAKKPWIGSAIVGADC